MENRKLPHLYVKIRVGTVTEIKSNIVGRLIFIEG
jgi:hypothetical protein